MNKQVRTVPKHQPPTSTVCENVTSLPEHKKCKSLSLENRIFMHKNGRSFPFPVYQDADVGIDPQNGGYIIELNVDQDVESTRSVINYGVRLCKEDLQDFIKENFSAGSDML